MVIIKCRKKVFSILNPNLRCGLEKGHKGNCKKVVSKMNHNWLHQQMYPNKKDCALCHIK